MANYKGIGFDNTNGRIRTATSSDEVQFAAQVTAQDGLSVTSGGAAIVGNSSITGNLSVTGTLISQDEQQVLVKDNFLDLNFGYVGTSYEQTGLTFNFKAITGKVRTIDTTSNNVNFTAGTSSNRAKVVADTASGIPADTYAINDLIQISGTTNGDNDGIYVVQKQDVAGTLEIKSSTLSTPDAVNAKFALLNFTTEEEVTSTALTIAKVDLMALRSSSAGALESATGDADGDFNTYTAVGAGSTTLQNAYDNGQTIVVNSGDLAINDTSANTNDFQIGNTAGFANFNATAQAMLISATGTSGADLALLFANNASSSAVIGFGSTAQLTVTTSDIQASDDLVMNKASGGTQQVSKNGAGAAGDDLIVQVTGNQNSSLILQSEGSGTDALKLATLTNGGSIDIDSAAAIDILAATTFSIGGTGVSNVTATSGNLTVSTATSGNLVLTSAADVDLTAVGELDVGAGSADIDITGALTLDSATMSIDSTDTTNLTMTANVASTKALTIAALNSSSDANGLGQLILNAKSNIKFQNGGTDKINLGAANVIVDTAIQASSTGGFKFGASGTSVNTILDQDTLSGDSATALATQQSIKAYVDSRGISNFVGYTTMVADETLAVGDIVAIKIAGSDQGRAIKANATASSNATNVIGICIVGGSATNTVTVAQFGVLGGYSSLTAGDKLYLNTNAGTFTSTAPSSAGEVVFQIGFASSATQIIIQPMFIMEVG
jgi:hypothetical protein